MEEPTAPRPRDGDAESEERPGAHADAALLARVRDGDVAAYATLYERHAAAARGLARHLTGGDPAAEDAVQDAFTKVLGMLRRGGGPDSGFRPYLLTAVRRAVYDRQRADRRVHSTDRIEDFDGGVPFDDPAVAGLERSMVARAYRSLPDRWREVLWHTEVEGAKPADVAPILGLTANGAAALAYRAREGLRQAYLQMHLDALPEARRECRPVLEKLGAAVRGGLAGRDTRRVHRHLDGCTDCKALYAELADVNAALREALGPLVLGGAAGTVLASKGGLFSLLQRLPKRQQQVLGGAGVVAVAAALAAGMMLVGNREPVRPAHDPPAAVQAVPRPPAVKPPAAKPAVPRPDPPRPVQVEPVVRRPAPRPHVPAAPVRTPPKRPAKKPAPEAPPVHEKPRGLFVRVTVHAPAPGAPAVDVQGHVPAAGVSVEVGAGPPDGIPPQVMAPVLAGGRPPGPAHGRLKARSRGPQE